LATILEKTVHGERQVRLIYWQIPSIESLEFFEPGDQSHVLWSTERRAQKPGGAGSDTLNRSWTKFDLLDVYSG
jgi:hypothetical protein